MAFVSKRADLLERGIQGLRSADPEVRSLVETVSRIPALSSPACAPRDEFVAALGLRLRAEALTLPAREARRTPPATTERRSATRPRVFVVGTGLPRILAGATASVLLIGALVGVSSRSALPDGLLYPVKQALDSFAVQLAGSELDRGKTLLAQSQEHLSDARSLVERDGERADPSSVSQALRSAYDAAGTGQRTLLGDFDRSRNPQALIAVQDFAARALPQLNALRPLVPVASRPDVDALIALLHQAQSTVARRIDACGQPCASLLGSGPAGVSPTASPTRVPSAPTAGGSPTRGLTGRPGLPSLPTPGGLPVAPPKAVIAPPGGATGPVPLPSRGTVGVKVPAVTVGPLTIPPTPIVIPPLPRLTTSAAVPAPVTGIPGLP